MQDQLISAKITPGLFADTVSKLEAREAQPSRPERVEWEKTSETFRQYWERLDEDGRHRYLISAGITVGAKHRISKRASYPTGDLDDGHILWVVRNGIELTVNLGDLATLRELAARHEAPDDHPAASARPLTSPSPARKSARA
jgi:hypothetical protein